MKLIHCADLHLDSDLKNSISKDVRQIRRDEIADAFDRMVAFAKEEKVRAILISGDMFENSQARKATKLRFVSAVRENPNINFYYLKGNHDCASMLEQFGEDLPDNLFLFSDDEWVSYRCDDVVISGRELNKNNDSIYSAQLVLDPANVNIVMLHGQEINHDGAKLDYEIRISELKDKNINYLAMGHIHKYMEGKLDIRGEYVYPGCLEGRGFDECGPKGFVLLEVENGQVNHTFIPFAKRQIHSIEVEVTPDDDMPAIIKKSQLGVSEIADKDIVRIVLTGYAQLDLDINKQRIKREVLDRFFDARIKDQTLAEIDYDSFAEDKSLKGEFVRLLKESDLSPEEKAIVAEYGIKVLREEKII